MFEPKSLRKCRKKLRNIRKLWKNPSLTDPQKWSLLKKIYEMQKEKCNTFCKFEFEKSEKRWNAWLQSAGGISQNLGKFIKTIKCSPHQVIVLKKPDGSLALEKSEVIAELK